LPATSAAQFGLGKKIPGKELGFLGKRFLVAVAGLLRADRKRNQDSGWSMQQVLAASLIISSKDMLSMSSAAMARAAKVRLSNLKDNSNEYPKV
jgi:hypothetical protein